MSICPEGSASERYMAAILILLLFDAAVLALWLTWKLSTKRKHLRYAAGVKALEKTKVLARASQDLCEGFSRSRGSLEPFEFEFRNLSLELPSKRKKILEEVTGIIEPGTVTAVLGAPRLQRVFSTLMHPFLPSSIRSFRSRKDNLSKHTNGKD